MATMTVSTGNTGGVNALMVIADGATTESPADVTDLATYTTGDRVNVQLRTPMVPLVTGRVSS